MSIIHGRLRAALVATTLGFGLCGVVGASPASAADLLHFKADGTVDEFSSHAEMRGWLETQGVDVPDEILPRDEERHPEGDDDRDAATALARAGARSARRSASAAVFYRHPGANRSPTLLRQGPARQSDLRRLLYGPCPNIPACNPRPSWNDQISSLRTVGRTASRCCSRIATTAAPRRASIPTSSSATSRDRLGRHHVVDVRLRLTSPGLPATSDPVRTGDAPQRLPRGRGD